jgi:hypothetical protein
MEERVSRRGKLLWCFLQIALFSSIFLSGVPILRTCTDDTENEEKGGQEKVRG